MRQFESLMRLAQASQSLNDALRNRDADSIMKAVSCQEDVLRQLQISEKEAGISEGQRSKIIEMVAKIKKTQRINKVLASSFLQIIDRTLSSLSMSGHPQKSMYGARGAIDMHARPILVHQSG